MGKQKEKASKAKRAPAVSGKERKEKSKHAKDKPKGKRGGYKTLDDELGVVGLRVKEVTGDGNCFFRALADQLSGDSGCHVSMRRDVVAYIESNEDTFKPFVEDDESFESYIRRMKQDATWAGHMELQAASMCLEANIHVYQQGQPVWRIANFEGAPARRTLHLSYHDGLHYNSVRNADDHGTGPPAAIVLVADGAAAQPQAEFGDREVRRVVDGTYCTDLARVRRALVACGGDVDGAVEWLIEAMAADEDESTSAAIPEDATVAAEEGPVRGGTRAAVEAGCQSCAHERPALGEAVGRAAAEGGSRAAELCASGRACDVRGADGDGARACGCADEGSAAAVGENADALAFAQLREALERFHASHSGELPAAALSAGGELERDEQQNAPLLRELAARDRSKCASSAHAGATCATPEVASVVCQPRSERRGPAVTQLNGLEPTNEDLPAVGFGESRPDAFSCGGEAAIASTCDAATSGGELDLDGSPAGRGQRPLSAEIGAVSRLPPAPSPDLPGDEIDGDRGASLSRPSAGGVGATADAAVDRLAASRAAAVAHGGDDRGAGGGSPSTPAPSLPASSTPATTLAGGAAAPVGAKPSHASGKGVRVGGGRERDKKPCRNKPCPCGSGKKYKACCMAADGAKARRLALAAAVDSEAATPARAPPVAHLQSITI